MSNSKYGETNWTDVGSENTDKKSGKDLFLRLGEGSNRIRLLTLPYLYMQHRWMPEGGAKYGYRVNCSGAHGSCPLCSMGDKAKKRWFLGVIDRATDTYKVLDIGPGVYKSILTFVRDEEWGSPDTYDIDIVVNKNGGPADYYKVVPKPKKVIASDIVQKEKVDVKDLERRTTPPEPVKVQERIDSIMEEIRSSGNGTSPLNVAMEETDETDNFFKNYDAKESKSV